MDLPELTIAEIGILVIAVLLLVCFAASGWLLAAPYPLVIGIFLIYGNRYRELRKRFRHTLPAMARIVDYHVETRRSYSKYSQKNVYQVWRPVVEFETEHGTVKAEYPIFSDDHWFNFDREYAIHYCPEQPEYFYFEDRDDERIGELAGYFYGWGILALAYTLSLPYCLMSIHG